MRCSKTATLCIRQPARGARMALGARPSQVMSGALRGGLGLGAAGLGIGLAGSFVFEVSPADSSVLAADAILLLAAAAATC